MNSESNRKQIQEVARVGYSVLPADGVIGKALDKAMSNTNRMRGRLGKLSLIFAVFESQPCGYTRIVGEVRWARAKLERSCRDQWLGWKTRVRNARISQVVELRHFNVQNDDPEVRGEVLKVALASIPLFWKLKHGIEPLVVEVLADRSGLAPEELDKGGWEFIGHGPLNCADHGDSRKRGAPLWAKFFSEDGRSEVVKLLDNAASGIAVTSRGAVTSDCDDFDCSGLRGISGEIEELLGEYDLPPSRYPFHAVVAICYVAQKYTMAYCHKEIERWSYGLSQSQLRALGFRSVDKAGVLRVPSHDTFRRVGEWVMKSRFNQTLDEMVGRIGIIWSQRFKGRKVSLW